MSLDEDLSDIPLNKLFEDDPNEAKIVPFLRSKKATKEIKRLRIEWTARRIVRMVPVGHLRREMEELFRVSGNTVDRYLAWARAAIRRSGGVPHEEARANAIARLEAIAEDIRARGGKTSDLLRCEALRADIEGTRAPQQIQIESQTLWDAFLELKGQMRGEVGEGDIIDVTTLDTYSALNRLPAGKKGEGN